MLLSWHGLTGMSNMSEINELKNTPTAKFDYTLPPQLANANPDQIYQYKWYVNAKQSLDLFKNCSEYPELVASITEYERKIGLI
ncbi:hypothetical protein UFOVP116_39 [uncultured Caudovirales phage]|uniref:Uncharacterized protein n=1 Tax=uncultured Caudovirales phage TaxID=2100421 RepID=A0A6J5L8I4_9CAUD|nr:hypothetical protein UFOVP116_39 [uncultured Caudovirales phage]